MKKLFSILALAMVIGVFSSCVIVAHEEPTYTLYFTNDTQSYVYDWFLKDKNDKNYAKSSDYCEIPSGRTASKSGLDKKDYQVWFCLLSTRTEDVYLYTKNFVYLDGDTVFYLSDLSFHYRSLATYENQTGEHKYVLTTSTGEELELETCVISK